MKFDKKNGVPTIALFCSFSDFFSNVMIAWLLIPGGIVVIVYAVKIVDQFFGEIPFAEKIFGSGGTYTFIKLLGLAMTLFSIVWLTGDLPHWLRSTFGKFFGGVS
ncbi:hypothetical protein HN954_03240 [bacterium]|nr:hypothetical protein [bacterium]MBT6832136.1 hypothetical protein [bacterium]MBT6996418.1 hypothetical protein [bacterium]MBT7772153.1 hypothetical protein [bacterium]